MDHKIINFPVSTPDDNPAVISFRDAVMDEDAKCVAKTFANNPIPQFELERAFVIAADRGYLSVVKELIKYDVDISGNNGRNASLHAGEKGHLEVVKFLCENGLDVPFNKGAIYSYAAGNNHVDVVDYLYQTFGLDLIDENNEMNAVVIFAPLYGHLEIIKYLDEHGVDIHIQNDMGLDSAVRHGHYDVAKYYVENGSDILPKGENLLRLAIETHNEEIADYLHNLGFSIENIGEELQSNEISNMLLKREKARHQVGGDANTFIDGIKSNRLSEVLKTAIDNNAKLSADLFQTKDDFGNSAIMILAARHELLELFKPELWHNNLEEMNALWQMVPLVYQNDVEFGSIVSNVQAYNAKQQFNQNKAQKPMTLQRRPETRKKPKL